MNYDHQALITRLFRAIDAKDTQGFSAELSKDVLFRFGNAPAIRGKAAVGEAVQAFFDSIAALQHDIDDIWQIDHALIFDGQVTYTRHDGSQLTVPFANIFKMSADKIVEYLIFSDNSQLYRTS